MQKKAARDLKFAHVPTDNHAPATAGTLFRNVSLLDKGKPGESRGRKAMGLNGSPIVLAAGSRTEARAVIAAKPLLCPTKRARDTRNHAPIGHACARSERRLFLLSLHACAWGRGRHVARTVTPFR